MSIHRIQPRDFPGISRGERATFGEGVSAAFGAGRLRAGFNPDERRRRETFEPLAEFVPSIMDRRGNLYATGDQLPQDLVDAIYDPRGSAFEEGILGLDDDTLGRLLGELAARGIEAPEEVSVEAIQARREEVNARYSDAFERERDTLGRMGQAGGLFAGLVGGIGAEFTDPANVALSLAGAPARVGFLGLVGIEAAINAGIEIAQTPGRNVLLRELGEEEQGMLENALMGAAFGGVFAGLIRGVQMGAPAAYQQAAPLFRRREARGALLDATVNSPDPVVQIARDMVERDISDELAAVTNPTEPGAVREHQERALEADLALSEGREPQMPERPLLAQPSRSILRGEIEEVDPRDLLVQPDVFQFRSNVVAEDGQTARLLDVTEWHSERAGIVIVYEYADGSRAVADGHQRTGLARRIMAQTGQEIRMAARVFREQDGFSPEDIRVLAALKNIAEASDGMSTAMARDAARVLRVRPEAITQLPAGPGIARARALSALSDEAFDMFINQVVPERFAELVGRMVENPEMHAAMMNLLRRTSPDTTAQAESILAQALRAPVRREVTADLFGEREIAESLYLERAKVLERAMRLLRDDQAVFRTLTDRADRIEGTGENRLDAATNRQIRQQVEQALAAVQKLAHRAGPISEALNDGATRYKETGRLADAARSVADTVRREIERDGLAGAGDGPGRRAAKPESARPEAPDPLDGFSDPVNGPGARAQVEATRIDPTQEPRIEALSDLNPVEVQNLKAAQGFRSVDDLMERGARNHAELTNQIEVAAQQAGVTARAAPLKGRARTEQKVKDKYAGDLNRVTDVARGGVDAATPEAADAFVRLLARRYRVIDEGWNVVDGGYFDRKLTVVFDDGMLGEVQLWVPGMFEVKEARGHKLYEVYRDLTRPEAERAQALADMEALYRGVMDKLPARWRVVLGQDGSSSADAPTAATASRNAASDTSGEPGSPSTSEGAISRHSALDDRMNMEPGEGSMAGIDRSTRKNLMGDTSSTDMAVAGRGFNVERTSAGEQGLFDGIQPITERDRLDQRMTQPLGRGGAVDDTQIGGLFDPNDPARADLFDQVPVGRELDADGNEIAVVRSRAEIAAELDADDAAVAVLDICVRR